jgi:hypothetical protein
MSMDFKFRSRWKKSRSFVLIELHLTLMWFGLCAAHYAMRSTPIAVR